MDHNRASSPLADAPMRSSQSRQKEIAVGGPRISPLPRAEISAEGQEIVSRLQAAAGVSSSADVPEIVATLLRHPHLYGKHVALGVELLGNGVLALRHRELAILCTAWLSGAPFEWGEHVAIARKAGIASAEIERITAGGAAPGWDPDDKAIVQAAEELHGDAMISDPVWAALSAFLDERQLIELVYVIGHYTKVAYLQNALRLRLTPGNQGLLAR